MATPEMTLGSVRRIYLLGIKGAGMTALAQVFKHQKKTVWGSDVVDHFFTDDVLRREKIRVLPFKRQNITKQIDLLVYSTAYNEQNSPELVRAKQLKIPMISYPEALGLLFADHYGIAVCGTHGKTTTTGMLGYVLQELKQDPLVVVGSTVEQIGGNARVGRGKYFVVEADEYQNKLRYYRPQAVILTSADFDHPDYFKNQAAYTAVFKQFIRRIPRDGYLVAFTDDPQVRQIVKVAQCQVIPYGQANKAAVRLRLPGEHNQWNATAVLKLIAALGLSTAKAKQALGKFTGAKRRFELLGTVAGVAVYDDYAHHPVEIQKMLQAARIKFPRRRIRVAFQAHSYSRTKALLTDFGKSFGPADEVVILDIFSSARETKATVTADDLVKQINRHGAKAAYRGSIEAVAKYFAATSRRGDVVLTVGAGENWRVGDLLLKQLRGKNKK